MKRGLQMQILKRKRDDRPFQPKMQCIAPSYFSPFDTASKAKNLSVFPKGKQSRLLVTKAKQSQEKNT